MDMRDFNRIEDAAAREFWDAVETPDGVEFFKDTEPGRAFSFVAFGDTVAEIAADVETFGDVSDDLSDELRADVRRLASALAEV